MRRACVAVLVAAGAISANLPAVCPSIAIAAAPSEQPDLKETLEKGLQARRPEEFDFIAKVMAKVNNGTLPRSLVESTFLWARQQPDHPFQHFEQGLKERAKKIGISL